MENAKITLSYKIIKRIRSFFGKRLRKFRPTDRPKDDFTIISCNCIGGLVYHDLGYQFRSPTINLFIPMPDFIYFCLDLENYLSKELVELKNDESDNKNYPVGLLGGDIRIHFMHYVSFQEAYDSWNRRKSRVFFDRIFVIASDRDGFDESMLKDFSKIPYNKVLFTHKNIEEEYCVQIKKDKKLSTVRVLTDYINIFGVRRYEYYFDLPKWLTGSYTVKECTLR